MRILFLVVVSNFIAQIPYYLHQYYNPRHLAPSVLGVLLMSVVLAWFLIGYSMLKKQKKRGYFLMQSFLSIEFLFYLQTQLVQFATGHGVLLHVVHPDGWLLFIVFLIGYINFLAAAGFISYLVARRHQFGIG